MKVNLKDFGLKDKVINIPDETIANMMKSLDLDEEEAIMTWLEDEEYLSNDEQEQLEEKAKKNRITATIHQAKAEAPVKEKKPRERKEDPDKENLIAWIAQFLEGNVSVENLAVTNIGKIIEFSYLGNDYKIDLIKKRKKK